MSSKVDVAAGLTVSKQLISANTALTHPLSATISSCIAHGTVRSEVALWQVPTRPSAQRGLTYARASATSGVHCVAAQAKLVES